MLAQPFRGDGVRERNQSAPPPGHPDPLLSLRAQGFDCREVRLNQLVHLADVKVDEALHVLRGHFRALAFAFALAGVATFSGCNPAGGMGA